MENFNLKEKPYSFSPNNVFFVFLISFIKCLLLFFWLTVFALMLYCVVHFSAALTICSSVYHTILLIELLMKKNFLRLL